MGTPGYSVTTKSGKKGRTFHKDELINGKQPVYLCLESKPTKVPGLEICIKYSDKGTLCDPKTLSIEGYID